MESLLSAILGGSIAVLFLCAIVGMSKLLTWIFNP